MQLVPDVTRLETPPTQAESRLCHRLNLSGEPAFALLRAMRTGDAARMAVVLTPRVGEDYVAPFACEDTACFPWLPDRVLLPAAGAKPTRHADYAAGCYYVMDLSSCWTSVALTALPRTPQRSLDLCAAPGGKSVLLAARFPLVDHCANEVNPARRGILRQNVLLCGLPNTCVTGTRPDRWAAAGEQFDLILVDAPCSGQSLLCKGLKNPGCLGASTVHGNAKRQRGILLAVSRCLSPGGFLLYSTCTYDPEENERVIAYILRRVPGFSAVEVPLLAPFRSTLSRFPAYRLMPHHGAGVGGFCCLLRYVPSHLSQINEGLSGGR